MCSPLICGTSNFPAEEYDYEELLSPCKAPRKSSKKTKERKNPYANRGREKFDALLAELESKKQKIYTQKGSQDISFIRFVSTSSGDWKPIVVKAKGRISQGHSHELTSDKNIVKNGDKVSMEKASQHVKEGFQETKGGTMSKNPEKKSIRSSISWCFFKMENLRHPSCYMTVMFILILLLLTVSGRTFTIICTSIGWYMLPMIKEKSKSSSSSLSSNPNAVKKKKEYNRRLSERDIVTKGTASPTSVLDGPEDKSPVKHTHTKSW